MNEQFFLVVVLASIAAAGLAYVFIYPIISGDARSEKRHKQVLGEVAYNPSSKNNFNRRDHVAQSLKELENKQKNANKVTLDTRIEQSGLEWSKNKFYATCLASGVFIGLITLILFQNIFIALSFAFIGTFGLPFWILGYLKKRRIEQFANELPNAMDVIVRGIRAGLPLGDCIRIVANEAQEPVKSEFRRIIEGQALGISVADSCTKMYSRVPISEANFFSIVINIQQKSGGNLSEALGNLSRVVRERKRMKNKIIAMSMEAKASAAIIAAMPVIVAIMTYFSSPEYIEIMWKTQAGIIGLIICGILMTTGVLMMRKMINFDF
jgi:tight adherence protein B